MTGFESSFTVSVPYRTQSKFQVFLKQAFCYLKMLQI